MKKYIYISLLAIMVLPISCTKDSFLDANVDQEAFTDAQLAQKPGLLLSHAQIDIAYAQGGDMSRFSSIFTQQVTGASRQAAAYNDYSTNTADFGNLWSGLYAGSLGDFKRLSDITTSTGNIGYAGVSNLLLAYGLGLSVDMWGDIPYSEAFKGTENLNPKFDDDAELYAVVDALVDASLTQLESEEIGALTPGDDDLIYGGDLEKWIKFGHALKAKQALHQLGINSGKASEVIAEAALAFSSNDDDAQVNFGIASSSASPWYQWIEQRDDIAFGGTLLTQMSDIGDLRYAALIDTDGSGPWETEGYLNFYYGSTNSPVHLITYAELEFMKAEAYLKQGQQTDAQTALTNGVTASFNKLGITDATAITDYITANATLDGTDDLATVMYEKQIALFLHPEAFTDYRRTGLPALSPVVGDQLPVRFMYPESEYSFNGDNVPTSPSLFTPKIFWDNN